MFNADPNTLLSGIVPPNIFDSSEEKDGLLSHALSSQTAEISNLMASLKTSWSQYTRTSGLTLGYQVKHALGNLFDKDRSLNSLVNVADDASAITFLSESKINTALDTPGNTFHENVFTTLQVMQLLDAAADAAKVTYGATKADATYTFVDGDKLSCIVRVTDGDQPTATQLNSNKWLVTMEHKTST